MYSINCYLFVIYLYIPLLVGQGTTDLHHLTQTLLSSTWLVAVERPAWNQLFHPVLKYTERLWENVRATNGWAQVPWNAVERCFWVPQMVQYILNMKQLDVMWAHLPLFRILIWTWPMWPLTLADVPFDLEQWDFDLEVTSEKYTVQIQENAFDILVFDLDPQDCWDVAFARHPVGWWLSDSCQGSKVIGHACSVILVGRDELGRCV